MPQCDRLCCVQQCYDFQKFLWNVKKYGDRTIKSSKMGKKWRKAIYLCSQILYDTFTNSTKASPPPVNQPNSIKVEKYQVCCALLPIFHLCSMKSSSYKICQSCFFCFSFLYKFWSVSLELFVKHKPWNWEECIVVAAGCCWKTHRSNFFWKLSFIKAASLRMH